ncbi:MAG: serine/threonine-protein kinase, partial [Bdellovibrionota bacterium]
MKELGDYRIDRLLGRGATAQVYLAFRRSDDFPVALKVFHPGLWDREDLKRRALSEVSTALALQHPNIVRIFEPHLDLDPPAMALEFVDGYSLEEFQGRLPYVLPEVSVLVVVEILKALEHAHAQNVVHRDLKPANIFVGNDGRVLVGDFGLARMTDVSRLTLSGTLLGSPDYMSPEQARGEISTPKSDLFSAASILYFLITGTRPFSRSSALATLAAVNDAQPEAAPRRNPKISPALARI